MQTPSTVTVTVTRNFAASAEHVFDAWLDAKTAAKWLFATPNGQMVRAEVDPHVGGRFTFTDRRDGEDVEHTGEYLEIDRPHRLVFTFGVPKYSPLFTKVTIEITPLESGCELNLMHEGVLEEYAEGTPKGWNMIFDGLENRLKPESREP